MSNAELSEDLPKPAALEKQIEGSVIWTFNHMRLRLISATTVGYGDSVIRNRSCGRKMYSRENPPIYVT